MDKILLLALTLLVSCGDSKDQALTAPTSEVSQQISFSGATWKKTKALIITTDVNGEYCSALHLSDAIFEVWCPTTELNSGAEIYVSAPKGAFTISEKDSQGLNNAKVVMK